MVMFNDAQWTGNYVAAGVTRITMHMINESSSATLYMRIALKGVSGTIYVSNTAVMMSPNGSWRLVDFALTASAMTNVVGADTLAQVLNNVNELRVLSSVGGGSFSGDPVDSVLGVDNITAHDISAAAFQIASIVRNIGGPLLSFPTIAGRTYRVERKTALVESSWIPLSNPTNVPGTGSVVQI
ncbi:MAG: hypothetical protein M3008_07685 [Chloroflexota bacterium]|nr:hypothetical protein [Chloroflexota bacterium]